MHKTSTINARIEPKLKIIAEAILRKAGLTSAEAIRLFYKQVCIHNGLPFEINIPNDETLKVFEETDKGIGIIKCSSIEELFEQLEI